MYQRYLEVEFLKLANNENNGLFTINIISFIIYVFFNLDNIKLSNTSIINLHTTFFSTLLIFNNSSILLFSRKIPFKTNNESIKSFTTSKYGIKLDFLMHSSLLNSI